MSNWPKLVEYIMAGRRAGMTDATIRTRLAAKGWSDSIIMAAFAQTPKPPTKAQSRAVLPATTASRRRRLKRVKLMAVVMLVLVGSATLGLSLPNRQADITVTAEASSRVVNDRNYHLTLPEQWRASSDYVDGAGVNVFYQSGDSAVRKARMTVFVVPAKAHESLNSWTSNQLTGLKQNGGSAEVLTTNQTTFGNAPGQIVKAVATPPSDPTDKTYYILASALYGETMYNINIMIPANQWQSAQSTVLKSVAEFKPKNQFISPGPKS